MCHWKCNFFFFGSLIKMKNWKTLAHYFSPQLDKSSEIKNDLHKNQNDIHISNDLQTKNGNCVLVVKDL